MAAADKNFVLSSWLNSHLEFLCGPEERGPDSRRLYQFYKRVVHWLLGSCDVTVACAEDDEDQICGWVAHERLGSGELVVHYAFTKYVFRGLGVQRRLWAALNPAGEEATCTFAGRAFPALCRARRLRLEPSLLFQLDKPTTKEKDE